MVEYSYCGRVLCSEKTICGYLPYEAHWAICGWCTCGQVICGDIPTSTSVTVPSRRNANAIAKVWKSPSLVYTLDLITADIVIANPSSDSSSITVIDNEILEIGDKIQIWIGAPSKFLVFEGTIVRLSTDSSLITSADIESNVEILKYKYLKSDITLTQVSRQDAIENLLSTYHSGLSYELIPYQDIMLTVTREYWAWDKTVWDILLDIYWDHNIYYIDRTLYITSPEADIGLELNYYGGSFKSWSKSEEQGEQFGLIRVDGSDYYKEKRTWNRGEKELSYSDMALESQSEVNRIADILAEEYNESLFEVQVELAYLFPPRFGLVHVKLPGLDDYLTVKEIRYAITGNDLSTSIRLGSHRASIIDVLSRLNMDSRRIPFVY